MAGLLDLADEIILEIISYLANHQHEPLAYRQPFYCWHDELPERNNDALQCIEWYLGKLSITCRRLHQIVAGVLYAHIPLLLPSYRYSNPTEKLIETLESHLDLAIHVRCVDIDVDGVGRDRCPIDFSSLFWLPNIQSLSIRGLSADDDWQRVKDAPIGESPVQVLRLISCKADKDFLTEMLSWPKCLKELWLQVVPFAWGLDSHLGIVFTCADIVRAMSSQAGSLEKLVLTRQGPEIRGETYDDTICLREFGKLKSLSTNQAFLITPHVEEGICHQLPRGLKELEVFYDDPSYYAFLHSHAPSPYYWLLNMLDMIIHGADLDLNSRGERSTPVLERLRIISAHDGSGFVGDGEGGSDGGGLNNDSEEIMLERGVPVIDEARGTGAPGSTWRPPQIITRRFISAGVSFSIFIDSDIRYRYVVEGGRGFRDVWEDEYVFQTRGLYF
ncbi:hypothetical protein HD806DRAFT_497900 [Xylariaceae sp. AK1471]|nr:hypothetical protein HD806DRAFT_497900 [Xylariaceae sp. AK1471]